MPIPTARCPSCEHRKASAAKNPDGLCDECNGGIYAKQRGQDEETFLHLTVTRRDKTRWIAAARILAQRGLLKTAGVSDFVTDTLNARAGAVLGTKA